MNPAKNPVGIAFDVVFDEKVSDPPKMLYSQKSEQNKKKPLTLEQIQTKQLLAEERRQDRIKERLKRMQQREESTKRLVESVDVLLQQHYFNTEECKSDSFEGAKMSSREVMETAKDVAKRFREVQQQLLGIDLKVDETPVLLPSKRHVGSSGAQTTVKKSNVGKNSDFCRGSTVVKCGVPLDDKKAESKEMAFEIMIDEVRSTKKPMLTSLRSENWKLGKKLTAEDLLEKQLKAAERRQKRKEERVRKTAEGRKASMELRSKVNIYAQHQAALRGEAEQEKILSSADAAWIAHEIANGFGYIHSRYASDLERARGFSMLP